MRQLSIVVAALVLAGCAVQPMTDQDRAVIQQVIKNNQAAQAQQEANGKAFLEATKPKPVVNCTTNLNGNTAYTTCQ